MKRFAYLSMLCLVLLAAASCSFYEYYEPIYLSYEELRSAIESVGSQSLHEPGKIYLKDNYVFLNERNVGIHVIDNSNPNNPVKISFINIPGNIDMAIRGNILFVDSYIDLAALDISDIRHVREVKRIKNAFPERYYYFYDDFHIITLS